MQYFATVFDRIVGLDVNNVYNTVKVSNNFNNIIYLNNKSSKYNRTST